MDNLKLGKELINKYINKDKYYENRKERPKSTKFRK